MNLLGVEAMDLSTVFQNCLVAAGDLFDGVQPPGSLAKAELGQLAGPNEGQSLVRLRERLAGRHVNYPARRPTRRPAEPGSSHQSQFAAQTAAAPPALPPGARRW